MHDGHRAGTCSSLPASRASAATAACLPQASASSADALFWMPLPAPHSLALHPYGAGTRPPWPCRAMAACTSLAA